MKAVLSLLSVCVPIVIFNQARAECIDVTYCFCSLVPSECEMLVGADVTESGNGVATLRITTLYHDPKNILQVDQVLRDLVNEYTNVDQGSRGVFLLKSSETCSAQSSEPPSIIKCAVIDSGGKYLCSSDPDFAGTTEELLVAAVLSPDCRLEVSTMGVGDCLDESGCCHRTVASTESFLFLLLCCLVLLPNKGPLSKVTK